jgi:CBS domain-containing protein
MLKGDIGALPVVDSTNKLVGMITDRDICMSSLIEGRSLKELPVSLAASTPAWACGLEDSIGHVSAAMQTHKVHRIPVVDKEEKLVGIIGLGDVVRATVDKKADATPRDLTQTLAAIMEPRGHVAPVMAS